MQLVVCGGCVGEGFFAEGGGGGVVCSRGMIPSGSVGLSHSESNCMTAVRNRCRLAANLSRSLSSSAGPGFSSVFMGWRKGWDVDNGLFVIDTELFENHNLCRSDTLHRIPDLVGVVASLGGISSGSDDAVLDGRQPPVQSFEYLAEFGGFFLILFDQGL